MKKVVNWIIHNVFPFNSVIWAEESGCGLTGDWRFSSITDFRGGSASGVEDFSGKASWVSSFWLAKNLTGRRVEVTS